MINVAVVVLNYNDSNTTQKFIDITNEISAIDKIIVVDNCSSDDSFEKLLENSKESKIDVIKTNKNKGYACGNNYGIKYTIEKYNPRFIAITNPDIVLNEECVNKIIDFYKTCNDNVAMVSCKMNCNSPIRTRNAWKLPNYKDCILENFIVLKRILNLKGTSYKKGYFEKEYSEVGVIPGSFFVIPTDIFKEVNYFDEDTFLYGEENILAFKLRKAGYRNYILNECSYIHEHSVSITKNIKSIGKRLDIAHDSGKIYLLKYLKCSRTALVVFDITYQMGKCTYLFFKKSIRGRKNYDNKD